jgi:hypothetical protein
MIADGKFHKLPKTVQKELEKSFLVGRGEDNGVSCDAKKVRIVAGHRASI